MSKLRNINAKINRKKLVHAKRRDIQEMKFEGVEGPLDTEHLLISTLLPPAVKLFLETCEKEVEQLAGGRYARGSANYRHGGQPGSIVLANQRIALEHPRVRSKDGAEVRLKTYDMFQNPELFEKAAFTEGLKRVSQRDYEKGLPKIASSFGFKKSSVSRKWIKATAAKIEELPESRFKIVGHSRCFCRWKEVSEARRDHSFRRGRERQKICSWNLPSR